jgi:autotransporter-associated beta strand protein
MQHCRAGVGAVSVLALTLSTGLGARCSAQAADATWTGATADGIWNTGGNWTPGTVPDGTAIFSAPGPGVDPTKITFASDTAIGTIQIGVGAPSYTFIMGAFGSSSLALMGAGIVNNSVNLPKLVNNGVLLEFMNSSSAANAIIENGGGVNFKGTSTAGNAAINNTAFFAFLESSNASNAVIDNGNILQFAGDSTAGNATITNRNSAFGSLTFQDNAKAGNAVILSDEGFDFFDRSTADHATITSNDVLTFFNFTSADHATITNNFSFRFGNDSTAASATIINNGSLEFFSRSTAANAAITNTGSLSSITFRGVSTAGNSTIANDGGSVDFVNTSSAGSATITNSGSLTFRDTSTAGNAAITNAAGRTVDFSASTGPNGDHKLSAGSIAGAGNIYLGANQLTIGGNNQSTTFSGIISDCGVGGTLCLSAGALGGSLVKTGSGTLTLTGADTYTGGTTVLGGTLSTNNSVASTGPVTVDGGGTLGGNGTVGNTTINNGTLSPGNSVGTITVNGNLVLTPAANYKVEVSSLSADRTNVTGMATLGGATVHAIYAIGASIFKQYTIIDAAGGVSGTFASLVNTGLPGNLNATLGYDATHAYLNVGLDYTASLSGPLSQNQQNVADTLTRYFNTNGTIPMAFGALTPQGLTGVSGELGVASTQAQINAQDQFLGLMLDPFIAGRGQSANAGGNSDASVAGNGNAMNAYAAVGRNALPSARDRFASNWSVWAASYGGSATVNGNAIVGSNDVAARVIAGVGGADYRVGPDTLLGFALGGGGTSFGVADGLGLGHSDLFQAGGFIQHRIAGAGYLSGSLAYGWQDVTTNRTIAMGNVEQLQARFNTNSLSGRIEGGWRFASPWLGLTPYIAGQVIDYRLPSYAERGSSGTGIFALSYEGRDIIAPRAELGLRTDKSLVLDGAVLTLRGRAAWAHNFDTDRSLVAVFQSLPGSSFTVDGARPAPDSALVSASAEIRLAQGLSFSAKFGGEFSSTTDQYTGTGMVRYEW